MTAEFLNPDMVAIPQCDRDFLREHGKVPRHWRIWIARYESTQRLWCWNHRSIALGEEDMDRTKIGTAAPSNSQTTTMCIGNHLLVHAISSEIAAGHVARWNFRDSVKAQIRQIWPAASAVVTWPPSAALTSVEMDYIAEEFFRRADKIARKYAFEFPNYE
jgi:hypothetical protein